MRINYDFTDIEAFLTLAEMGSFQRAAKALNMSQPTLTRRIHKLETVLGTRLFERTTRSLRITLAGRNFQDRVLPILDAMRQTHLAITDSSLAIEAQCNAVITIATIPSATQNILPNTIRRFCHSKRKVRFRILENLAGETLDLVNSGEADFGISFGGLEDPTLDFQPLLSDRFVLALDRSHPLSSKSQINWSDLADYDLIVPWKGTGNRMLIDNALAETGQRLEWFCEIRHSSTILSMVRSGVGIAPLPLSVLPQEQDARVIFRELKTPQISRCISIVTHKSKHQSQNVREFINLMCDHA